MQEKRKTIIKYVPHGINENHFFPIREGHESFKLLQEFKKNMFGEKEIDFVVLFNSRNIRRKSPGDVILSYKLFCDMIGQENNGQWTTLLGERLVYDVLKLRGENPRKPVIKGGFAPDWETDDFIYEVKTSNWWVSGPAGEKVFGTFVKYQDIPELYGKPLKIVCLAYQEEEFTNGKTKYFGENITKKTKQVLDLAASWNIEYVKFSDLVLPVMSNI